MQRFVIGVVLLALASALAACEGAPGTPQNNAVNSVEIDVTAPPVESGKTTVVGRVVSTQSGQPLTNTIVRLAEVYREGGEGAFALDGANSPGAITDDKGTFVIPNIDAREYVMVVGDVYDKYVIVEESSGKARVWTPAVDDVLNVGELKVNL